MMHPMNCAWIVLKQGGGGPPPLGGGGPPMPQVQPGIEASTLPHAYKPDQLMAISHNLANDLLARIQTLRETHEDVHDPTQSGRAVWDGAMHDAQRIQDLLERAMSGNKPEEPEQPQPQPGVGGGGPAG